MDRYLRQVFPLPLLLVFLLLLDGSVTNLLSAALKTADYQIVPAFTFIALILLALHMENGRFLIIMAAVIGFIYDSYYMSILGVNIFLFPLGVFITRFIGQRLPINFYSTWLWSVLCYIVYSHILYFLYQLINLTSQGYQSFMGMSLIPGLLFNAVFVFICNWFIMKLVFWVEKD